MDARASKFKTPTNGQLFKILFSLLSDENAEPAASTRIYLKIN